MEGKRRLRQGIVFFIVFGVLLFGWKAFLFFAPVRHASFVAEKWRGEVDVYNANTPRSQMVDDLIERLAVGTPRSDLLQLLGAPEMRGEPCDYYHLGFRGDLIDPFSLALCYDGEGRLTGGDIRQH